MSNMQTQWRKLSVLSVAGALSWLGSSLTTFAVMLRDKDEIGAIGVSYYALAFAVPVIVLSPISGWIADKFSTLTVLIPLLSIMGLSSMTLAFDLPLWWTPIALIITATAGAPVGPAFQAAIVTISNKDDLPRVNGLMQSSSSVGMLFAPALGGILVKTTGYVWPFIIDAISFWLLALTVLLLGVNRKPVAHEKGEKMSALEGMKFAFGDPLIRAIVILLGVLIIALASVNVGEIFLAQDELGADELIYGIIGALFAGGSILGAVVTAAVKLKPRFHGAAVVASIALLTLCVTSMSLAPHWGYLMVLSLLAGFGNSGLNAYAIGIVMSRAPQAMLGRVNAAIGAVITTGSVLGMVIAGRAIDAFGVRPALLTGGLIAAGVLVVLAPAVLRAGRAHRIEEPTESAEQIAQDTEPQH